MVPQTPFRRNTYVVKGCHLLPFTTRIYNRLLKENIITPIQHPKLITKNTNPVIWLANRNLTIKIRLPQVSQFIILINRRSWVKMNVLKTDLNNSQFSDPDATIGSKHKERNDVSSMIHVLHIGRGQRFLFLAFIVILFHSWHYAENFDFCNLQPTVSFAHFFKENE